MRMRKRMKKTVGVILGAGLSLLALAPAAAQRGGRGAGGTVQIKVASPLPAASEWGKKLTQIAAEWQRVSNGQIRVTLRQDGLEGGESKMLSSLDSNQIQAAVFTSFGLSSINPAVMTVSCPFLIRDDAELDVALDAVRDEFEEKIRAETNYVIIAWSKGGWVNVFSRTPVRAPGDLKAMKIASAPDADDLNNVFRAMGYQITEVDQVDIATKMASGVVAAAYQNPAAVAAYKLHTVLKNMMAFNIAPVLGGVVMNKVTWEKLDPSYRDELLAATRRIAATMDVSMQKLTQDAVAAMSRGGLTVNRLTPAEERLWVDDIQKAVPRLMGTVFDPAAYDKISATLERYRSARAAR